MKLGCGHHFNLCHWSKHCEVLSQSVPVVYIHISYSGMVLFTALLLVTLAVASSVWQTYIFHQPHYAYICMDLHHMSKNAAPWCWILYEMLYLLVQTSSAFSGVINQPGMTSCSSAVSNSLSEYTSSDSFLCLCKTSPPPPPSSCLRLSACNCRFPIYDCSRHRPTYKHTNTYTEYLAFYRCVLQTSPGNSQHLLEPEWLCAFVLCNGRRNVKLYFNSAQFSEDENT